MTPSPYEVEDMVACTDAVGRSISFTVKGNPTVQSRTVMAWKGRAKPYLLDPSKKSKRLFAKAVRREMKAIALPQSLYFSDPTALALRVKFVLPRHKKDLVVRDGGVVGLKANASSFPRGKDVDNLLKFVKDALQATLYRNDTNVVTVNAEKCFASDLSEAVGWTELTFFKVVCIDA
jgi:Holliday junction resolvase RusA-like endonuclease